MTLAELLSSLTPAERHVLGEATAVLAVAAAKRLDAILRQIREEKKKAGFPISPDA